jgi:hypothetical protein
MEARAHKLICYRSKLGDSLRRISKLTRLTIDQVKEALGQATGLTAEEISIIFYMKQAGRTLEQISKEVQVAIEVLTKFLPQDTPETDDYPISESNLTHFVSSSEDFKEPSQEHPQFIYGYSNSTSQLCKTNLVTGELSYNQVPDYQFKYGCRVSELPGGSLLITGGSEEYTLVREVEKIDTLREFAVSSQSSLHTARYWHAAVYDSQYLYVLGGYNDSFLRECERYSCADDQWEVLPVLPVAGFAMSAVVMHRSLFALGGETDECSLDTVQRLSLKSLTWQLMALRLPQAGSWFPCFKLDTKVYLLIKDTLYAFTPYQVKAIKTVPRDIQCYSSYCCRGNLYYTDRWDQIKSLALEI